MSQISLKPCKIKLALFGETRTGKSSLALRFVNNEFQENKEPTIGAAFLTQRCRLEDKIIEFNIWDTSGQETLAPPMYYRNAQAVIVVYDVTKASTLDKAKSWVKELQHQANLNIVIALAGNKIDLVKYNEDEWESGRQVPTEEAKAYANEAGLLFFETSARKGDGVRDIFIEIAKRIPLESLKLIKPRPNLPISEPKSLPNLSKEEKKNEEKEKEEEEKKEEEIEKEETTPHISAEGLGINLDVKFKFGNVETDIPRLDVLMVEDNVINQVVMSRILGRLNQTCDIAGNGNTAIRKCENKEYDVIFMDISMADMDGFQTTEHIRNICQDMRRPWIIALLANALWYDQLRCIESGMNDFMSKPARKEDIRDALIKYVNQRDCITRKVANTTQATATKKERERERMKEEEKKKEEKEKEKNNSLEFQFFHNPKESDDNYQEDNQNNNATKWIKDALKHNKVKSISFNELKKPESINKGGFGCIMKAIWTKTNSYVVYKRLTNTIAVKHNILNAFVHELQIHLHLDYSDRIVRCLGISQDEITKEYLLVMQYADGGDLQNYLENNFKNLNWDDKKRLSFQIAEGLNYLHNENVLHRDLHSKNIVIHERNAKITDFGISKFQSNQNSTAYVGNFGSVAYMEPKRILDPKFPYTESSDIYSFGVLMWEISSGYPPFKDSISNSDKFVLVFAINNGVRENVIPDTPKEYEELYKNCWDQEPEKRPTIDKILEEYVKMGFGINKLIKEKIEITENNNNTTSELQSNSSNSLEFNFTNLSISSGSNSVENND